VFGSTRRVKRTGANGCEWSPRLDKLGVTGSSPVPPISEALETAPFLLLGQAPDAGDFLAVESFADSAKRAAASRRLPELRGGRTSGAPNGRAAERGSSDGDDRPAASAETASRVRPPTGRDGGSVRMSPRASGRTRSRTSSPARSMRRGSSPYIVRSAGPGSWRGSAWLLERQAPERWAARRGREIVPPVSVDDLDPFREVDELAEPRRRRPNA
jgi:hypothetical protein